MKHNWHEYELTNAVQFAELIVGAPVSELREVQERLTDKDFRETVIACQDKFDIIEGILCLRAARRLMNSIHKSTS